jgi:hypothetical protein
MGTLHEDLYTFMIVSHQILPKILSVLGKSGRENQNTHFMFNDFFPKILPVICDDVRKYRARHTLRIHKTYCFSMITVIMQMRLHATCLSC